MPHLPSIHRTLWLAVARCALALPMALTAWAAGTDIANAPLFTSSGTVVHPNIMFYLDDSGSMSADYLPDHAPSNTSGKYGYKSYQCNGLAYNPNITYKPPVDYNGAGFSATASYTQAFPFFFTTYASTNYAYPNTYSGSNKDLSTLIDSYYYRYTGAEKALNYTYNLTAQLDTSSNFFKECNSAETAPTSIGAAKVAGAEPGNSVFQLVWLNNESAAQKQNYANWYSYYRTRMLMMKTSTGLSLANLDDRYRVGFNTINNRTADPAVIDPGSFGSFLDPKEFDTTQKRSFYKNLYITQPYYGTPLRGALAQAGQYYAYLANGQVTDPVQYSCQKNFTILSTDGYWNQGGESNTAPTWGPYKLDKTTTVGQQDGAPTLRPMLDGEGTKVVTKKTWTITNVTNSVGTKAVTRTWAAVSSQAYTKTIPLNSRTVTTNLAPANNSAVACTSYNATAKTCIVSVTTSAIAGYAANGKAIVSGTTPTVYSSATPVTVLSVSGNTFTYQLSGLISQPANASVRGKSVPGICPNGTVTTATQNATSTQTFTATYTDTYTQVDNQTTTTPTTAVTPYTETITTISGVVSSDATVRGTTTRTAGSAIVSALPGLSASATPTTAYSEVATSPSNLTYGTWTTVSTANACYTNQALGTSAVTVPSPTPIAAKPNPMPAAVLTNTANGATSTATVQDPAYIDPVSHTAGIKSAVTTTSTTTSGGSSNSLADIAMYYYNTDLRTAALGNCSGALGNDVCENNVGGSSSDASVRDSASWQHLTTYTLGLGNAGTLAYDPQYLTQVSGDYVALKNGTRNWPVPAGDATNIDDLWHAAVNGRGQYFSASDPNTLNQSLTTALDTIKAQTGSASAASTSALQPVQGDNDIYVAKFTSALWYGDLLSYSINPDTGAVAADDQYTWSAQAQLDKLVQDHTAAYRTIYYAKPSGTSSSLSDFTYANMNASTQAYFDNFCSDASKKGVSGASHPAQCTGASATNLANANSGQNLVDYLRGDATYASNAVFRQREHLLGDIINAAPLFVGQPAFRYTDNGYAAFAQMPRTNMVYAAANDGMLHAFERSSGVEKWAFVPTDVLPKLYQLADIRYSNFHRFLVDGSPVAGDVYDNTESKWRSLLVGGLGAGGSSYYALDITTPESPKLLWEYRDADMGLTFGNPIITKLNDANGTWVVLLTSGYNNHITGDGNGHLYVLNAVTGALIMKIDTKVNSVAVGSTTTPSGLAKINNYVESDTDNTTKVVYGGDLLGNVWRFDINSLVQPYLSAMRLAQLKVGSTPQPIATKPSLAQIAYNGTYYKVLYVGTGKYLGASDLANTATQTIYALKDNWDTVGLGDVRAATNPAMVVQTAQKTVASTLDNIITGSALPVDWSSGIGWYLDLIGSGERVTVNPMIVLNSLYVGTNVPSADACSAGGVSWLYKLDIATGSALNTAPEGAVATSLGNVLIVGMTNVLLTTNNVATVVTKSNGSVSSVIGTQPGSSGPIRKTSWRVLN